MYSILYNLIKVHTFFLINIEIAKVSDHPIQDKSSKQSVGHRAPAAAVTDN